jgi:hypothetical protein
MARKKLERIVAPTENAFVTMTKEQLLLDGSQGAKDELYRRSFNRLVKKSEQA